MAMLNKLRFHNIISAELGEIGEYSSSFYARDIILTDIHGDEFRIELYADEPENIEVEGS